MPLAQRALKTLSAKYNFTPKGPILVEIFPNARRLRGAHARPARHDRRARRLFRPRRDAGFAARGRPAARFVLVAVDALARDGARHHAADVEPARAAVADGRHLRVRRSAGAARAGKRDGSALRARAGARQDAEARGSELRVHAPRHDRAGLFPGLGPRRSHRPHAWRAEAAGARPVVRAGAGRQRRGREDPRRLDGGAAGLLRQVGRCAVRRAADRASHAARRTGRRRPWRRKRARGAAGSRGTARGRGRAARQLRRPARVRPGAGGGGRSRGIRAAREGGGARAVGDGRRQPARDHGAAGRGARRSGARDVGVPGGARARSHDRSPRPAGWRRWPKGPPRRDGAVDRLQPSGHHRSFRSARAQRAGAARAQEQPGGDGRARVQRWRSRSVRPIAPRRIAISPRRICSPIGPRRPRSRRWRRSRSRPATIGPRSCCCGRSRARPPPVAVNEAVHPRSGRRGAAAVGRGGVRGAGC